MIPVENQTSSNHTYRWSCRGEGADERFRTCSFFSRKAASYFMPHIGNLKQVVKIVIVPVDSCLLLESFSFKPVPIVCRVPELWKPKNAREMWFWLFFHEIPVQFSSQLVTGLQASRCHWTILHLHASMF